MFLKKYIPFKSCLESRYVPTETNDEIEQVRESVIKYTCQLESFIDQFQQEKEANRKLVDHYFTKALAAKNDNDHIEYHHNVTSYLISKKNVQYYNTMITTALEESSRSQQLYQVTAAKLTAKKFTINNDFTKTLGDNNQVMTDNKALEEYSASIKESLEKIINTEKVNKNPFVISNFI